MAEAQLAELLQEETAKPGLSIELRYMLGAMLYGVAIGALVSSALWWWLS